MSDLNQIQAFVRVIQQGSFSKAAQLMGVPKSTISHRVQELEKNLGVSLLRRTTRQLTLTPAGEEYFRRALLILQDLELLEEQTKSEQNQPQGRLKFTAPSEMGNTVLPVFLCDFVRAFPKIELDIELTDRRVDLVKEGFDCALRGGKLADSTLRSRHIGQSEFGLFASPAYLKANPPIETVEDLRYHKAILFSPEFTTDTLWRLQSPPKKRDISPASPFRTNSLNLTIQMTLAGQGIGNLPRFFAAAKVADKSLVRVLPEWAMRRSPLSLVYPPLAYRSKRLEVFLDFMTERLRKYQW